MALLEKEATRFAEALDDYDHSCWLQTSEPGSGALKVCQAANCDCGYRDGLGLFGQVSLLISSPATFVRILKVNECVRGNDVRA